NGTITLTIEGGTPNYTISWTGPDGFTSSDKDLTDLAPGTYNVTVTDANGCEATTSVEVGVEDVTITVTPVIVNTTCIATIGSIDITVAGGTEPYDFAWTGPDGFTATTEDIADLAAGDYTVVVTDANGCETEQTFTVGTEDVTITLTGVAVDAVCTASNGSITLMIEGGTPDYTISWTGPNGFTSTDKDLTDLAPGTYNVTVTDANGCEATTSVEVGVDDVTITVTPVIVNTTCIAAIGSIDITVAGGTEPYTYLWSNGATTEDIADLAAGDYTVTVTDANGCETEQTFTVGTEDVTITLTGVAVDAACTASNGTITLTIEGGTPEYTISWTGPAGFTSADKDLSGLAPGTYNVTVTDANGCEATTSVEVGVEDVTITVTPVIVNTTCIATVGTIDITVAGGTEPYTYLWSNGATTEDITDLAAGDYAVTVTDANGCETEQTFTVGTEDVTITVDLDKLDPTCEISTGTITVTSATT